MGTIIFLAGTIIIFSALAVIAIVDRYRTSIAVDTRIRICEINLVLMVVGGLVVLIGILLGA